MDASPTAAHVTALQDGLRERYGTRIIDKSSATETRLVGWFLERIGVLDAKRYLERLSTTIGQRVKERRKQRDPLCASRRRDIRPARFYSGSERRRRCRR